MLGNGVAAAVAAVTVAGPVGADVAAAATVPNVSNCCHDLRMTLSSSCRNSVENTSAQAMSCGGIK